MTQRSVYAIYGVRVPDDTDGFVVEDDIGQCRNDGAVGVFWAGAHDRNMTFLALRWKEIEPGEYTHHSGVHANASLTDRDRWNDDLRAAADHLNLEIVEGPGWFTILSED
jgi:hypothetical protein